MPRPDWLQLAVGVGVVFTLFDSMARAWAVVPLVHFVIQAAVKLVVLPGDAAGAFPLVWMAAAAIVPWLAFFARRPPHSTDVRRDRAPGSGST